MTEVTTSEGVRTGACVVRTGADGRTGLRITVTARLDVEDPPGERRAVTTSVAAAITRVGEFLEAFVRDGDESLHRVPGDTSTLSVRKEP